MYFITRKKNKFCFVKSDANFCSSNLIKSIFSPKWYGSSWQPPTKVEKKTWKTFLETSRIENPRFNQQIEQSWLRCKKKGVDPIKQLCERYVPVKDLEYRSEKLIALSQPMMETLFHCVQGSEFVIALSDWEGNILKSIGGMKVLRHAESIGFGPGAVWSEESVGTNAIGTAQVLGLPVQVTGTEHYCESHQLWTCSTSPIRDQHSNIIGFLDISGPQERATTHELGLIVAASQSIEERIILEESYNKLYEANKYMEAILNSVSDGIIAVNAQGLITGVNDKAAKALQRHPGELVGNVVGGILKNSGQMQNFLNTKNSGCIKEETLLKMPNGNVLYPATANPILSDEGSSRGFILTFSPVKKSYFQMNPSKGTLVKFRFQDIIGESTAIRRSIEMAKRVATGPSSVLILGESGTGKELFAQAIHYASDYSKGPFVSINCGAIPNELIQSELFGYKEGSFTGAKRGGSEGKFGTANGGTLFLDEIGEMPFEMQVNLLRVLEENAITPLGSKKAVPIDVRIIAATNKSLFEEVSKGRFREDLYYRLNVISLALPPLRAREADIRLLADYFVQRISRKLGRGIKKIDPEVLRKFEAYRWPGNVRELVNAVEHTINFSTSGEILVEHLPEYLQKREDQVQQSGDTSPMSLAVLEKEAVEKALRFYNGNITHASKALGIRRNTLYDKIKRYGIK